MENFLITHSFFLYYIEIEFYIYHENFLNILLFKQNY